MGRRRGRRWGLQGAGGRFVMCSCPHHSSLGCEALQSATRPELKTHACRHVPPRPQAIAAGMFLDGLPQTLTPLGLSGAGAPDVQAGLRKTLRAVLDVQGPIRRLAATVEAAVAEQAAYVQRAAESERAGEWNTEVRGQGARERAAPVLSACRRLPAGCLCLAAGLPAGLPIHTAHPPHRLPAHPTLPRPASTPLPCSTRPGLQLARHPARGAARGVGGHGPRVRPLRPPPAHLPDAAAGAGAGRPAAPLARAGGRRRAGLGWARLGCAG